jgi:hypothetical protein
MVVVTDELKQNKPDAVAELYRLLEASRRAVASRADGMDLAPFGKEANRACLDLLMDYAVQQNLVRRRIAFDELW